MSASLVSAKGESPLTVTKTADGFALSGKASGNESLVLESPMDTLRKFKHGGESINAWFHMGARYVANPSAAVAPKLTLDIVPTGQAGEFQVVLKGQPCPRPSWSRWWIPVGKRRPTPMRKARRALWKAQYVLRAMHIDKTPGERQGASGPEPYDAIGYVATLTFVKPDGVTPLPAGPVRPPNKLPAAARHPRPPSRTRRSGAARRGLDRIAAVARRDPIDRYREGQGHEYRGTGQAYRTDPVAYPLL
ncbi:cobalt ABC transporter substrate-binding protein [Achromobacter xylosoxidans]